MGAITIINTTPYKEQPVPEVGKEYHIFDDGKIKPSRHYSAKVLEIIPFKKDYSIDNPMGAVAVAWRENVLEYEFLFAQETDYFIKAESSFDKNPLYSLPQWLATCCPFGYEYGASSITVAKESPYVSSAGTNAARTLKHEPGCLVV